MADLNLQPIIVSAEWRASLERLAAHNGVSLEEWLRRAEVLSISTRTFHCGKCDRDFELTGRWPALPIRPPGDAYKAATCLRVFESGLTEVYGLDGEQTGYFCPGCAKMLLEPAFRILRMLNPSDAVAVAAHNSFIGKAMGFMRGLFGGRELPAKDAEAQKALPPAGGEK